ncbi:MAG: phosphoribosylglycinamide formyltransferase [Actinobacteria bacterium]|nr:MAG: phosphoribosylglycinamide formyltransferase [Actinomycetota bacterium]
MSKLRLGVLISGSGTNLQAIIDACEAGTLDAEVAVVVANHVDARGLDRARRHKIDAVFLDRGEFSGPHAYNTAIRDEMRSRGVDYVVMAGYMRLLGSEVLDAFPNRVLNIHPALLPSFAGAHGIKDAFEYGVKVTGVTIHFANEVFDEGPIIAQEAVVIEESDRLETLEAKIHAVEHRLYPEVLQKIAEGRLTIDGRVVRIAE